MLLPFIITIIIITIIIIIIIIIISIIIISIISISLSLLCFRWFTDHNRFQWLMDFWKEYTIKFKAID